MTPDQLYARTMDAMRSSAQMSINIPRTGKHAFGNTTEVLPELPGKARAVEGDIAINLGPWTLVLVRPHHILGWMAGAGITERVGIGEVLRLQHEMATLLPLGDITVDLSTPEWKALIEQN